MRAARRWWQFSAPENVRHRHITGAIELPKSISVLLRRGIEVAHVLANSLRVGQRLPHRVSHLLNEIGRILVRLLVQLDGILVRLSAALHLLADTVDLLRILAILDKLGDFGDKRLLVVGRHGDPGTNVAQSKEARHAYPVSKLVEV